jgi:hypothetical protein
MQRRNFMQIVTAGATLTAVPVSKAFTSLDTFDDFKDDNLEFSTVWQYTNSEFTPVSPDRLPPARKAPGSEYTNQWLACCIYNTVVYTVRTKFNKQGGILVSIVNDLPNSKYAKGTTLRLRERKGGELNEVGLCQSGIPMPVLTCMLDDIADTVRNSEHGVLRRCKGGSPYIKHNVQGKLLSSWFKPPEVVYLPAGI